MRTPRTGRAAGAGFTLIELMVGLVVASMAVGFIFRIYAASAVAYRTQSQIAETMQSLRTAKQVMTKRLRNAGYLATAGAQTLATSGTTSTGTAGIYAFTPLQVVNSSTGPDAIYLSYADTSCEAHVSTCTHGCPFNSSETRVDSTDCFADGDIVVAVRTGGSNQGEACVLQITNVQSSAGKLQHHPSDPYNDNKNQQCDNVAYTTDPTTGTKTEVFSDGNTYFMRFKSEAYRIKPSDARGVLQHSDSGGVINDWQDIAFGFVDMQFAIQTMTKQVTIASTGSTTSYSYGWLSGDNMTTWKFGSTTTTTTSPVAATIITTTSVAQIRVNLLARTIAEVEGAGTAQTPSMLGSPAATNPIGDHGSVTTASITNTSSPYYGNYAYRMVSTVVDLRNLGTGAVQ
jgi:prepilin-type N-terminal cleavage/methylation domain-containing protein